MSDNERRQQAVHEIGQHLRTAFIEATEAMERFALAYSQSLRRQRLNRFDSRHPR